MNVNDIKLTARERKLLELLEQGGKLSVADITRALGYCDPRSYIARMRRKGVDICDERVTDPSGVNFKLYWLKKETH